MNTAEQQYNSDRHDLRMAIVWLVAGFIAALLVLGLVAAVVENAKDRRQNNQERCLALIKEGQFLCSQDGTRQQ